MRGTLNALKEKKRKIETGLTEMQEKYMNAITSVMELQEANSALEAGVIFFISNSKF